MPHKSFSKAIADANLKKGAFRRDLGLDTGAAASKPIPVSLIRRAINEPDSVKKTKTPTSTFLKRAHLALTFELKNKGGHKGGRKSLLAG